MSHYWGPAGRGSHPQDRRLGFGPSLQDVNRARLQPRMNAPSAQRGWFEISEDGWARLSSARPMGRLLLEAVQNALDAGAANVSVDLSAERLVVEDDATLGITDERLVYTLFLSDKMLDPSRRGRMGRGLKELLAAAERARVETVGATIAFGPEGRVREPSERERGTRIVVERRCSEDERTEAEAWLRLVLPPRGVTLKVNGRAIRRPRVLLGLPSTELETVIVEAGVERAAMRSARIDLYPPRRNEVPHLFEMGVPIQPWNAPWHCDVGQRVPLGEGRDGATERYVLALKAMLLEATIHRNLDRRDLTADWVQEVIGRWPVRSTLLDAYVSKVFPRGSLLPGSSHADDRARQLGAHIVEAGALSSGTFSALARVLETSDEFVRRRSREAGGEPVEPDATQAAFAEGVRFLAKKVAGSVVRVRFFSRGASDDGWIEDALTDVGARVVSFNVQSKLRFDDLTDPTTLGVVLHELAHLVTAEHDRRFVDRLQYLGAATANLFAAEGRPLLDALRSGDVGALARHA